MELDELDNLFLYHAPSEEDVIRYSRLRLAALEFAKCIIKNTPVSQEQQLAITTLRESLMIANAAIACNESNR